MSELTARRAAKAKHSPVSARRSLRKAPDPLAGLLALSWGDRLHNLLHLSGELLLARWAYKLKRPLFKLSQGHLARPRARAQALVTRRVPSDPWPGDARAGADLLDRTFAFAGQSIQDPTPLWMPPGAGAAWLQSLHGFGWLRDLRAFGGDSARRRAREMVQSWCQSFETWQEPAWTPLATGNRIANLLGCYDFYALSADTAFRGLVTVHLQRQTRYLAQALPAGLAGADLLAAVKGLVLGAFCLPGTEACRARALALLERELDRQVLADGGHVERSPERLLAVLRDLIDLRALLSSHDLVEELGATAAPAGFESCRGKIQLSVQTMAPALRLFRHGDGTLALFNGTRPHPPAQLDLVLQRAGGRLHPLQDGSEIGFQRLARGPSLVIADCGAPPRPGLDGFSHAGTLSFEMSVGSERLIVNCGALDGGNSWRQAQRATAAHSTLVLNDTNSATVVPGAGLGRRPEVVTCKRIEDDKGVAVFASHDGYRSNFQARHRRRLGLSMDGKCLQGEDLIDTLSPQGDRLRPFALHFHLHPDVGVTPVQGGGAILRLPKGGGWQFEAEGAEVELQDSIYFGGGELRRTRQLLAKGKTSGGEAKIAWSIRQIPT